MKKIVRIRRKQLPLKKKQSLEKDGDEVELLKPKSVDIQEVEKSEKATAEQNPESINLQTISLPLKSTFYLKNGSKFRKNLHQVKQGRLKVNSFQADEVFKKKTAQTPSFSNTIICQKVWTNSLSQQKQSKLQNRVKSLIENEYKISVNKRAKSLIYKAVQEELGKIFGDKTVYFQKQFTPLNKKTNLPSLF